jgi:4-amino-4-deoxy-L-arabinose transferase-like glycosyltransferase
VPPDGTAAPPRVLHPPGLRNEEPREAGVPTAATEGLRSLGRSGRIALVFALLSGLLTHAYHLFDYPLYQTDEGIYMERAWAIIREHGLSPQTYVYDHAPAGWIMIAAWVELLPRHFEAFGNPVNAGRVLMVILHVASTFFLFEIARKFSGGLLAPLIATFFFNFSFLAVYYQRMALLDNIMVFWVLLSVYLPLRRRGYLFTGLWSGLAFGISVVTKENAIFFAPAIFYLIYRQTKGESNRSFAITFWLIGASAPIVTYFLYATLKGELFPKDFSFNLNKPPRGHVSLLYEMWYQIHRNTGTLFARTGTGLQPAYLYVSWLPKDPYLLVCGTIAMVICLWVGWRQREQNPAWLIAGGLAFGIAFYLARGSVILDFYVIPLIPLYALCIALVGDRMLKAIPIATAVPSISLLCAVLLLLPTGGYLLKHNAQGHLQLADPYHVPQTFMQNEEIAWVRQNIPTNAHIVSDDDIWVALHDVKPVFPYDQSHWNAATDPQVRNKIFGGGNWQDINYIVMSNGMKQAMQLNNGSTSASSGVEAYMLNALYYHSTIVWQVHRGNVHLFIYKINP